MAFGNFSVTMPVEVVPEGGMLVRQVDVDGVALDDATDKYSLAIPCTLVDGNGTTENGNATFSVWLKVTLSPNGVAVVRCDSVGTAINTPFDTESIPTLNALTLNTNTVVEDAAASTVVGTIQGKSASSVLSLVDDAGGRFALAGSNVEATGSGLDYEAATSHNITVRETLAGASNTPRDSIITINVTNVLEVTLNAITVDTQNTFAENAAPSSTVANLAGKTSGSTLSVVGDARFSCSGSQLIYDGGALDFETEPTIDITIRETHADGSNSPNDSVIQINVTDVDENVPQNTVAPFITGGNEIGDTLNVDDGTWDLPRTFTGRYWFSSPNIIVGESETSETQLDPNSLTSYGPIGAPLEGLYIACLVVGCNANGCSSAWSNVIGPIVDASDVTPPSLSSASGSASGSSTASLAVTTNEDNGTLYWVVTTSATAPSAAQVKTGLTHLGGSAPDSGSQAVASTGVKSDNASGLSASTVYYAHFMHEDASSNQSTVVSSASFTTDVAPAMSAPVLTATTTTENPPEWDSDFDDWVTWDGVDSGDQHRLIWRLGGAGGWTTEDWQGLDDELLSGGFTWPLYEAAKPFAGGSEQIEVKEQRRRMVGGVQDQISAESNTLTFTGIDSPPVPWEPTDSAVKRWYDFTDLSTMFTDTAGTTPVTTDAQAVARVNDKGSDADHAVQATSGDRPTYRSASNVNSSPGIRNPATGSNNHGLDISGSWGELSELMSVNNIQDLQAFAGPIVASSINPDSPRIIAIQWDNSGGAGNGTVKWFRTGTQFGSTTTGLTLADSGLFVFTVDLAGSGQFNAGRIVTPTRLFNRAADGRAADGDFTDIMYWLNPATALDTLRQYAEGYLAHKTGFTLPTGHPYESAPPTV